MCLVQPTPEWLGLLKGGCLGKRRRMMEEEEEEEEEGMEE